MSVLFSICICISFCQGGRTLRQQLYALAEQWDGVSPVAPEDVPQLMLEGLMGRLGMFSFSDINRETGCTMTYSSPPPFAGDVQHLTSCNDEGWIHACLHWSLVLHGTTETMNKHNTKQKYSGWLADRAKVIYQVGFNIAGEH